MKIIIEIFLISLDPTTELNDIQKESRTLGVTTETTACKYPH